MSRRAHDLAECHPQTFLPLPILPSPHAHAYKTFKTQSGSHVLEGFYHGLLDAKGNAIRYMNRSQNVFYIPPGTPQEFLNNVNVPVFITEGVKKALAIDELMRNQEREALVIAINGVYGWKVRLADQFGNKNKEAESDDLPDYDQVEWAGRQVVIVFDANVATSGHVRTARSKLHFYLRDLGALTNNVNIPAVIGVNGIDDYIGIVGAAKAWSLLTRAVSSDVAWPNPKPVGKEQDLLSPLPKCNAAALLPSPLKECALADSVLLNIPVDGPAACRVVSLAGAVGARARVIVRQGFKVIPNLFGGIIAPPSTRKTDIPDQSISVFKRLEQAMRKIFLRAVKQHNVDLVIYKKAYPKGPEPGGPDEPEAPKQERLILEDTTYQCAHAVMIDNPKGLIGVHDELTSWFTALESSGQEAARSFFMKCWNGNKDHTSDRIIRGQYLYAKRVCLSMWGNITPARFASYLRGTFENLADHDGLMARFQLMVFPDGLPRYDIVESNSDYNKSFDEYEKIIEVLAALDELAIEIGFDAEAQQLFNAWQLWHQNRFGSEPDYITEHLGKYASMVASIALLFELVEWAKPGATRIGAVSLANTRMAIRWAEFLECHARKIYSMIVPSSQRARMALVQLIRESKVQAPFTARDVERLGCPRLNDKTVHAALGGLEDDGWVRPIEQGWSPGGGRPTVKYELNPALTPEFFASERVVRAVETKESPWEKFEPSPEATAAVAGLELITLEEAVRRRNLQVVEEDDGPKQSEPL